MPDRKAHVVLQPIGATVPVAPGTPLADALALHGVEFPCGGRGRCRGCRVRVVEGFLPETQADRARLSAEERAAGWRLACQAGVTGDLSIELRQWSGLVLADESEFPFTPADGLGVAVDVGTTTVVAQLMDLRSGAVLGTRTGLNPQARHGGDVMSRITAALAGHAFGMRDAIRSMVASMVAELVAEAGGNAAVTRASIVGNTAMHHLFLGHDVAPLSRYPFVPERPEAGRLTGSGLGWPARARDAQVLFLPVLGGFVGSDILAVILATRLHEATGPAGAADLGTNGEIVFTAGGREIVVASTAAGPAFEGARISCGMRASPGAVDRVAVRDGKLAAHVIGGVHPKGVCGSGLVDAVACGLDLGLVAPSGRLPGESIRVKGPVVLTQADVRELQLAKGAIAAGIRILMDEVGLSLDAPVPFYLAGAFGNSLSVASARRIGLVSFPEDAVRPSGNAALLGAKMVLGLPGLGEDLFAQLLPRIRHVPLEQRPDFQDLFAEYMGFPEGGGAR